MIRIVSALFAFAVLLCGWIIFQPFAPITPSDVDVTRGETDLMLNAPGLPALVDAEVPAQDFVETASNGLPDLSNATVAPVSMESSAADLILAASGDLAARAQTLKTDETTIAATTAGILAGLGIQIDAPAPVTDPNDPLFAQTQAALTGIQAITGIAPVAAAPAAPADGLQTIVAQALKEGQSDAYIDALLNEAAAAGQVSVPEMLVTSEGKVDTAVLLASIVSQAQIAAGGAAPVAPEIVGGEGVEVRIVQRANETEQYQFYTVGPGDSLGAIAVKFYGSVEHFPVIFDANKQILSSPDRIQTGQRLVIPQLG